MSALSRSLARFRENRESLKSVCEDLLVLARSKGRTDFVEDLQPALQLLNNDMLCIAVVGEFKGGKSTLVNAFIGAEVLPTETVECTSALTQVRFAEDPGMTLHKIDGTREEHPLEKLSSFATMENRER